MNRELATFVGTYLHFERVYDAGDSLRPTLLGFSESFVAGVREGFAEVLRECSMTLGEYERLTEIEFPDDDSLYAYLEDMNAYLFEGREEQPAPPEE
ncbi:hypothetical protein HUT18_07090 [Streptomyces sp. NA04227]|nr:hypothetical protein HUT18_07090 [Streptomyces sp. NA04227]